MNRSKAFLVVGVLLVAAVLGASAAPAARYTTQKAWCAHYMKQHQHEWATSRICPTAHAKKPVVMPAGETNLRSLNRQIADLINKFRSDHGLHKLHISVKLNASSLQHSEEMGVDGYFDHNSADGTLWWKRIRKYYP
ncbi:MAG TPA: CAP domain-containing protein, partial [Gaiellaceae bacterium]